MISWSLFSYKRKCWCLNRENDSFKFKTFSFFPFSDWVAAKTTTSLRNSNTQQNKRITGNIKFLNLASGVQSRRDLHPFICRLNSFSSLSADFSFLRTSTKSSFYHSLKCETNKSTCFLISLFIRADKLAFQKASIMIIIILAKVWKGNKKKSYHLQFIFRNPPLWLSISSPKFSLSQVKEKQKSVKMSWIKVPSLTLVAIFAILLKGIHGKIHRHHASSE